MREGRPSAALLAIEVTDDLLVAVEPSRVRMFFGFWRQWFAAWERADFEYEEFIDAGDSVVTILTPEGAPLPDHLNEVGIFSRTEAEEIAVGYQFDLRTNEMTVITEPNPTGGTLHTFSAYRTQADGPDVALVSG
jgi:hypothetical protein